MGTLVELARKLRPYVEKAAEQLGDQDVSAAVALLPPFREDGGLITAGKRINWRGVVKKAACDLWATAENAPDQAPDAWLDIGYREGVRIIPQAIEAGAAFMLGEKGWWQGEIYASRMDHNVWTPDGYPEGWERAT